MILTDKSKKDFLDYYWENYIGKTRCITQKNETEDFFNSLIEPLKTTLIIEWFDLININIHTDIHTEFYEYKIYVDSLDFPDYEANFYHPITRNEVRIKAIEKANEIYNSRYPR